MPYEAQISSLINGYIETDLGHSGRIRGRILPTQIQPYVNWIQDPLRWSWPILFQISINKKSSILNTYCPCIK